MKRYKLKRELPTFKAGDIFALIDSGSLIHESDGIVAYTWTTIDKFPNILTDWFEGIKESTRWKPEDKETYYYVGNTGDVYSSNWNYFTIDQGRFEIGNCFQTREEAERVVEYLKALAVVRGDATSKFVRGKKNWYVYYNTKDDSLHTDYWFCHIRSGIFGLPYFATEEDAERSIEQHMNEWLTIFGVKEENEVQK